MRERRLDKTPLASYNETRKKGWAGVIPTPVQPNSGRPFLSFPLGAANSRVAELGVWRLQTVGLPLL
jgi:hypothetical protein